MDLKIIQSMLERVQIHINARKPNNLWDLKDFSEEQQTVELFRTNKGLVTITKQTNKKNIAVNNSGNNTVCGGACLCGL